MVKRDDYKARMAEEFNFVRDKANDLEKFLRKYKAGKLEGVSEEIIFVMRKQHEAMLIYLDCLKVRAIESDVDLKY